VPWKANLVDLRWGGNFTNGPRMGAIETPGAWPEPLNLRDWVLRFVPAPVNVRERPLDVVVQTPQPAVQAWRTAPKHPQGSMLSINARGHRAKPAPKPPKPARVVPKTVGRSQSNDLTFLLERRLNRYKKNG
jgi:hypothetical protein